MTAPVRLGLLAAARITGPAIIEPLRGPNPVDGVELVAVGARTLERARRAADEWHVAEAVGSYDELLERDDLDAVYIATPAAHHRRPAVRALANGIDVLCEKPLAANADDANTMVDAARSAGKILMEAFHWRYHPLVEQLSEILRSGRLGTVERVDAAFDLPEGHIPRHDIRWNLPLGGGALMDLGCYPVQWVRFVAGEPTVVSATADCPVPGIDARLRAELAWSSGATGSIRCSMIEPDGRRDIRLDVFGTDGRMSVVNPLAPQHGARIAIDDADGHHELPVDRSTTYSHQLAAFVEAVRARRHPATGGHDSVATMRVIDACYRAAGLAPRATHPD